jgi:uncharacterized phiE125 gp8 family phage protein
MSMLINGWQLPTMPSTARPLRAKIIETQDDDPISIYECRTHIEAARYGADADAADDAMIRAFMLAAVGYCEQFTGLSLRRRTVEVALDEFPTGAIELPLPPLVSVLSIVNGPTSDDELDSADYVVDDYSNPAKVVPVTQWPYTAKSTNTVKVRYTCGYSGDSDSDPMPYQIRAAVLLVMGHLYANREDSVEKTLAEIPMGAKALMRPLRVHVGFA